MTTRGALINDLLALGITPGGTLLVHSSMRAVGPVEGGGATVLDALATALNGGLLVLPTHTWESINENNPVFDPSSTPSCVGALSNLFLKRPSVIRSWHPTHSLAASGNDAADFASGEEAFDTPCPRAGCYGKLYDRDAQILFLGCTLKSNTFLHGVEEWNNVPNRIDPTRMPLTIRRPDGSLLPRPMHPHRRGQLSVSESYDKVAPLLLDHGIARRGRIGNADCWLCQARPMADCVSTLLQTDQDWFLR